MTAACDAACNTCSGGSSTDCTLCATNYEEVVDADLSSKDCRSECPTTGYYELASKCYGGCPPLTPACDGSCLTCDGSTASDCLSCSGVGSYVVRKTDGTCGAACGTNELSVGGVCQACGGFCSGCTSPADDDACSDCKADAFEIAPSQCRASCNPGQSFDANNVCYSRAEGATDSACDSACDGCSGGANTQCAACQSGYLEVVDADLANKHCVNSQPARHFLDASASPSVYRGRLSLSPSLRRVVSGVHRRPGHPVLLLRLGECCPQPPHGQHLSGHLRGQPHCRDQCVPGLRRPL